MTEMATIEVLNDDCLMHILGMLNLKERLILERVSKRWKAVLQCLWREQHTLSLDTSCWGSWTMVVPPQGLRSILNRCGYSLYKLDVSAKSACLNIRTLQLIACKCPNLRILNISGLNITPHGARALGSKCTKLKELYMERCPNVKDSDLKCIFNKNIDLEVVDLAYNININGQCIMGLGPNVKDLNLMQCSNLQTIHMIPHLRRFNKLVRLNLDACVSLRSNAVKEIFEAVPQLQNLSMANYFPLLNVDTMLKLNVLNNLQVLNLFLSSCVNDDVLVVIGRNCKQLHTLDISCCCIQVEDGKSITDRGLNSLASLPNLQTLFMSYIEGITDHSVESIAMVGKLINLQCRGCYTLSDRAFKAVLRYCEKLNELDVSGSDLVTEEILKVAIEHVKNRNLTLIVGGTAMRKIPDNVPSNILIRNIDLSIKHFRPDYVDDDFFPPDEGDDSVDTDDFDLNDSDFDNESIPIDMWEMDDSGDDLTDWDDEGPGRAFFLF